MWPPGLMQINPDQNWIDDFKIESIIICHEDSVARELTWGHS